jgi:hypothetical protein
MNRRGFLVLLATASTVSCKKPFLCTDTSKLSPEEAQNRITLGYADTATDPKKTCANCQQYVPSDDGCGGCKILKGPIHPNGSCKVHALRT